MKKIVFINNQPMSYAEVSEKYGIPQNTLRARAARMDRTQKRKYQGEYWPVFSERQLKPARLSTGGRPKGKKAEDKPKKTPSWDNWIREMR